MYSLFLVPDLITIIQLDNINISFTTEFYCLLRGVIDQNFGEILIGQAETIPKELLQLPLVNFF